MIYGVSAALLHLYTSGFGTFEPRTQRGLHLLFLLPLIYMLFPATKNSPKNRPSLFDVLASLLCFAGPAYIIWNAERLNFRMVGIDEVLPVEMILGSVLVLLVVEAARRALSRWMALTIAIAIFYLATALAGSGMVVGILTRTGAALAFGSVLLSASFNNLLLAMILVFLVVSVLGTGIPTTPSYIIAVTVGASALGKFDVALLSAHLFVFYYAVLSDLTPPDAITAFAAANLAGSEMMATGIEAFKLGIAGFLIPFAFVFQPALLLHGTFFEILKATGLTSLGVLCLAAFLVGHIWSPLNWTQRLLFAASAILLVFPTIGMELIGIGLALGLFVWTRIRQ